MSISFDNIPNNWRKNSFMSEIDNSNANSGASVSRKNIIPGHADKINSAYLDKLSGPITTPEQAASAYGRGSMLHRQFRATLAMNKNSAFYALPLTQPTGNRSTGKIVVAGTAEKNMTADVMLGASKLFGHNLVSIEEEDTASEIALAIKNTVNEYGEELTEGSLTVGKWYEITKWASVLFDTDGAATNAVGVVFKAISATITLTTTDAVKEINNDMAVIASVATGTPAEVNFTYRDIGIIGNLFDIRSNYYGVAEGDPDDAGLSFTTTAMNGGTGEPSMTAALANISTERYFSTQYPFATLDGVNTSLEAIGADLIDRWKPESQKYGHLFVAVNGTVSEVGQFGNGGNNEHATIFGVEKFPTPIEEILAAATAKTVASLEIDPARPLQTLPVSYIQSPDMADRWNDTEENILLYDGITPLVIGGATGAVSLGRVITNYQLNAAEMPDDSYLDVTTPYSLAAINDFMKAGITSKYPRHKLVKDVQPIPQGHAMVKPKIITAEFVSLYSKLAKMGIVQDVKSYIKALTVEINATNPKRLDIEHEPILVGGLVVIAVKNKFSLGLN